VELRDLRSGGEQSRCADVGQNDGGLPRATKGRRHAGTDITAGKGVSSTVRKPFSLGSGKLRTPLARRFLAGCAAAVVLLTVAVAALYRWPLDDDALYPPAEPMSFAGAIAAIAAQAERERADPGIRPECRSVSFVHPRPRAKAVLLLHGYRGCPGQLAELGRRYYELGYNVYLPLAPRHGRTDSDAQRALTARELTAYAGSAMDITAALGTETGVTGTSAGGVLAAWLATTRPGQVHRLLAIVPFFRPHTEQASPYAVRPLTVLYGHRLLPDRTHRDGYSYAALAQYLRLSALLDTGTKLPKLKSAALVSAARERIVDRDAAVQVTARIGRANQIPTPWYEVPDSTRIGHDAVDPARLGPEKDLLYDRYIELYEGWH
jgi:esterase/lipase